MRSTWVCRAGLLVVLGAMMFATSARAEVIIPKPPVHGAYLMLSHARAAMLAYVKAPGIARIRLHGCERWTPSQIACYVDYTDKGSFTDGRTGKPVTSYWTNFSVYAWAGQRYIWCTYNLSRNLHDWQRMLHR